MIQFYVPFTERNQQTLDAAPPGTVFVDVSDSPDSYWRAMCDIWAESLRTGNDVAIIEHDVVCHAEVVPQFTFCPEPWCSFAYDNMCHVACRETWANQLGCTRFRAELIAACPEALSSIEGRMRDWHFLCDHAAGDKTHGQPTLPLRPGSIRAAGFSHHWHEPPVAHHPWFGSRSGSTYYDNEGQEMVLTP
jgi:hypothetical protein